MGMYWNSLLAFLLAGIEIAVAIALKGEIAVTVLKIQLL